jgi:4-amino-4-deoxy-L-arabinose transferase-like glycosyltransferase
MGGEIPPFFDVRHPGVRESHRSKSDHVSKQAVVSGFSAAPKQTEQARADQNTREKDVVVWLVAVFAAAAALRLWFNFGTHHANAAFSCDAAEYLRNAQTLLTLWKQPASFWSAAMSCLSGTASADTVAHVRAAFSNFNDFFISGPIFPLYLIFCYSITGTTCDIANWAAPVAVQSFLTAATCVLIALIGCHCWDKKTGITAGFIAAFYPAFILNSERFYSESFACFLLCFTCWLTVRGFTLNGGATWSALPNGVATLALQLTRSIMFIFTLALFPITYFQTRSKRPWIAIILLTCGCALVALPWLGLQNLAFGRGGLVVDRVGHYNFFTGNNVDTQGWLSFPYPDGGGLEQKSFIQLAKESFKKSPSRWLKLMLDKPARLFKFPWNDFRAPIGPFSQYWQVMFHQIVLLLAACGLVLGLSLNTDSRPNESQIASRLLITGLLIFQCVYMLFITVPRYNLTAMPMVILFAAAGLVTLVRLNRTNKPSAVLLLSSIALAFLAQKIQLLPLMIVWVKDGQAQTALTMSCLFKAVTVTLLLATLGRAILLLRGNKVAAIAVSIILAVLSIPSLCLPIRAHGRWYEWQAPLDAPGERIVQKIQLPAAVIPQLRNRQCYLLINADGWQPLNEAISLKANGLSVEPVFIPNLPFLQDLTAFKQLGEKNVYLEGEYIFECLTYAAGISNLDLRQWFLVPLPPEVLQRQTADQPLQIVLESTKASKARVFGEYNTDPRLAEIPDPSLYSWEKAFYGVENENGFSDTGLDTKIRLYREEVGAMPRIARAQHDAAESQANSENAFNDLAKEPGLQTGEYLIRMLAAPPVEQGSPFLSKLQASNVSLSQSANEEASSGVYSLKTLPTYSKSDCWLIRLHGQLSTRGQLAAASIHITAHAKKTDGSTVSYDTPWAPRKITASPDGCSFDLAFPLAPGALPGQLDSLDISMQPLEQQLFTPDLSGSTAGKASLKSARIEIYKMPSQPMSTGHNIF